MIYQAMERVVEREEAIDLVTVTTELGNDIYAVGGTKYLLELAEAVVSTAPLKKYEQFILDAYRLRASRKYMMEDRKSTRLNSSHVAISYAVFCLKKKRNKTARME